MDLGLAGKTAVITGGSGGIGRGLVMEFAREGLNVVSASRDAKTGVRVNNICPGWIVPEAENHVGEGSFWNRFGFDMMGRPDEMEAALADGTLYNMSGLPIPRLGRPQDIAHLALFLSSDLAGYITGQQISVSGGAYMP